MSVILTTVIVVASIGVIAAVLLYIAAKKFHVEEDSRIAEVESLLPGANCGGCGRSGCHDFAVACVGAETLDGIACPVGGSKVMAQVAKVVGLAPAEVDKQVAIVRCNGSCANRVHTVHYDGVRSCAIEASVFAGETACAYGCLGGGDCVAACPYGAMYMDEELGLTRVNYDRCVGCGKCVKACPRGLITLVTEHEDRAQVWVSCMNHDKGAIALKECNAACIGCGKCMKSCPTKAVKVTQFAAMINPKECISCGSCVEVCPRKSIVYRGTLRPVEQVQTNL
jgi:Na+-translocating ferredoxin:NAD+ oxidoreductase RNF subunit RnfB